MDSVTGAMWIVAAMVAGGVLTALIIAGIKQLGSKGEAVKVPANEPEEKPVNNKEVDFSPITTRLETMNESILYMTRITSKTVGTVEQLCERMTEVRSDMSILFKRTNELIVKK